MDRKTHLVTLPAVVLFVMGAVASAQENSITPTPAEWTDAKKAAVEWVDAERSRLNEMSLSLWEYAEPGMLEYRSAELLADALEDEGFTVELMGVMANYYREHLHPSARIHYVVMEGGKAPNVVPDFAKAWYYLRGGTREMVDEMYARIQKMTRAAALATDTREEIRLYTSVNHTRNSTEGAKVMHANLQLIGAPEFTEKEQAFAKAIQKSIGIEEKGLAQGIENLLPYQARDLDRFIGSGSTDVAEVSLIAPTMGVSLAASPIDAPSHHWSTVACSGHSIGEKAMLVAAKVMAATALDIIDQPATLAAMRDGHIAAVGTDVTIPSDAIVLDADGWTLYPGFVDAHSIVGMPAPADPPSAGVARAEAARKAAQMKARGEPTPGLRPELTALELYRPGADEAKGVSTIRYHHRRHRPA